MADSSLHSQLLSFLELSDRLDDEAIPRSWHASHSPVVPELDDRTRSIRCGVCDRLLRNEPLGMTAAGVAPCGTPAEDLVSKYWGVTP